MWRWRRFFFVVVSVASVVSVAAVGEGVVVAHCSEALGAMVQTLQEL